MKRIQAFQNLKSKLGSIWLKVLQLTVIIMNRLERLGNFPVIRFLGFESYFVHKNFSFLYRNADFAWKSNASTPITVLTFYQGGRGIFLTDSTALRRTAKYTCLLLFCDQKNILLSHHKLQDSISICPTRLYCNEWMRELHVFFTYQRSQIDFMVVHLALCRGFLYR